MRCRCGRRSLRSGAPPASPRVPDSSRIEALSRLADSCVEQMRVALERDQRARVAGDRLDELHVGARSDETRDACVAEVVEAIAVMRDARVL